MSSRDLADTFLPLSAYLERPADVTGPLDRDLTTAVAVVGGGWTGLSAAIELRRQGTEVVLLEQNFCGYGASGRSGGHLVGPGKEMRRFFPTPDAPQTREYARYIARITDIAEAQIRDLAIDCDYLPTGNLFGATHPKMLEATRALAAASSRAGFPVEHLEAAECRERGLPAAWIGGMYIARGGSLHPGKYVLGLRRKAIEMGVTLCEQTAVTALEEGRPVVLRTARGSVRADRVILASGAFTPTTLGRLRNHLAVFRIGAFETAPLTPAQFDAIGWRGREGLVSMHNVIEGYRVTAHGTIVANTKRIFVTLGNRIHNGYDPAMFEPMVQGFRDRFPALHDLPIASTWGGWCALTQDMLPHLGTLGEAGNIHYGLGFNGHGVAPTAAMGQALAHLALGQPDPNVDFLRRKVALWPPEPLRWLGATALLKWFDWQDDRTDRDLRRMRLAG